MNKKFRMWNFSNVNRGVNKWKVTQIYFNLNKIELDKTSSWFADAFLHDVQIKLKEASKLFINN